MADINSILVQLLSELPRHSQKRRSCQYHRLYIEGKEGLTAFMFLTGEEERMFVSGGDWEKAPEVRAMAFRSTARCHKQGIEKMRYR